MTLTIEELTTFCKKKGFVYPSGEIYGGLAGFFDYGPLGVEVKNSIKRSWWKKFVHSRQDVVGIDGSIITNPKVWHASGHVDCFEDILVEDSVTKERFRADHLVEDVLKIPTDGMDADALWKLIQEKNVMSPKGNALLAPKQFNLMFKTNVGPVDREEAVSYMRPETAQLIFANFKLVQENARMKLPFGIAQIGKVFRNEISPRDFLFRTREFEQMEIEFFVRPTPEPCSLLSERHLKLQVNFLSEENQKNEEKHSKVSVQELIDERKLSEWHAYWLAESYLWYVELGVRPDHLRIREHLSDERSHYSSGTFDVEYAFPFGWKEIHGNANRGTFDLGEHEKHSKQKMTIHDEKTGEKLLAAVIEPSFGIDRAFLTFMFDAYVDDTDRGNVVLKLHPKLAPYSVAVFPLVKKDPLLEISSSIMDSFREAEIPVFYDQSGSVGRRYARQDEIGTPYCVTIDFESIDDKKVTVRSRDTTEQKRVLISDLVDVISDLASGRVSFENL